MGIIQHCCGSMNYRSFVLRENENYLSECDQQLKVQNSERLQIFLRFSNGLGLSVTLSTDVSLDLD